MLRERGPSIVEENRGMARCRDYGLRRVSVPASCQLFQGRDIAAAYPSVVIQIRLECLGPDAFSLQAVDNGKLETCGFAMECRRWRP